MFRNIDYCSPVTQEEKQYDKVVDLSFGINTNTELHKWWVKTREKWDSFVSAKYKIAQVPLVQRWKLIWNRNVERENRLNEIIVSNHSGVYNVVHEKSAHKIDLNLPVEHKVLFEPIEYFNIFDWYKVLLCSQEIHCIDSSLCNFVEVLSELKKKPKFYYALRGEPQWNKTILLNNWRKNEML
jgi:hypothetical protein